MAWFRGQRTPLSTTAKHALERERRRKERGDARSVGKKYQRTTSRGTEERVLWEGEMEVSGVTSGSRRDRQRRPVQGCTARNGRTAPSADSSSRQQTWRGTGPHVVGEGETDGGAFLGRGERPRRRRRIEESADASDDTEPLFTLPNHVRCAAHTLSLIATTDAKLALKTTSFSSIHHTAMSKASALWNKSGRPKSAEVIKEVLGCSLRLPCVTRWNSLYDAIVLLLKHRDKLNETLQRLSLPIFRPNEINFLSEYVTVLKPIACALDRLQGEEDAFYGVILPTLFIVEGKLEELASRGLSSLRYCRPLVDALLKELQKRFGCFLQLSRENPAVVNAIIASTTHPYFKLRWLKLKPAYNDKETEDFVKCAVSNALEEELTSSTTDHSASDCDVDEYYGISKTHQTKSSREMVLLSYLEDPDNSLDNIKKHREIKKVFLKYNTTLPSSAQWKDYFLLVDLLLVVEGLYCPIKCLKH